MMAITKGSPVFLGLILVLSVGLLASSIGANNVDPNDPFTPIGIDSLHFPPDFYFGSAVAAYQVEGTHNKSGKGPSIWDTFTHEFPERIDDGSNGDVAVDFYNKYREDIRLMSKEVGLNAFRFSISWPRVIPSGRVSEGVNEEGIAFYNRVIDEAKMNGLEPFVTIFHWDLPQALEDKYGGFLSSRIVGDFKDFAELCFERFGDRVKHWITLNEPYEFSMGGYESGSSAPGRCSSWVNNACLKGDSSTEPYIVGHHLILAHAQAVNLYRTKYRHLGGMIGITLDVTWTLPLVNTSFDDIQASQRSLDFKFGWFMEPINFGHYPESMKTLVGARLPEFTWEEIQMVKRSYDFIGINSYTSSYVTSNFTPEINPAHIRATTDTRATLTPLNQDGEPIGEQGTPLWLYVYPQGILEILKYTKDNYNDPIIYITENGIGDALELSRHETLKDDWRVNYHQDHLTYIRKAICEFQVRVKGYFVWTFMDNLEWATGFTVRMGLYSVDRSSKELTRRAKDSAVMFQNFLKNFRQGKGKGKGNGGGPIPEDDYCSRPLLIKPQVPEDGAATNTRVDHDEL